MAQHIPTSVALISSQAATIIQKNVNAIRVPSKVATIRDRRTITDDVVSSIQLPNANMRRNFAVLLLLLTAACAWKFLSLPHSLLNTIYRTSPSPIPQFILDARRPWVEENKRWLDRREDAAQLLCALNSTVRPDSAVAGNGSRTYPVDLFHRLEIDNNRAGVSRDGWPNAVARLGEMLDCPAALLDVTELYVDIFVHHDHDLFYESTNEPSDPLAELPGLFADALLAMPNLRILHWGVPAPSSRPFERLFVERNLTLPGVRDLYVGVFSEYMRRICPGIESLQPLHDWYGWGYHRDDPHLLLVRAAASATHLTRFGMEGGHAGWDANVLQGECALHVQSSDPQLTL